MSDDNSGNEAWPFSEDYGLQQSRTIIDPLQYVRERPGFRPSVEQVEEALWRYADGDDLRVYCLINGYNVSETTNAYGWLLDCNDLSWAHMWQGKAATGNVQSAPYIVALKRGHRLNKWLIEEGWGRGWALFFVADTGLAHFLYGSPGISDKRFLPSNGEQLKLGNLLEGQDDPLWKMRRHFRSFTDVWFEPLTKLVDFNYCDPWVLESYMIASGPEMRKRLCAPIKLFFAELSDFYPQFLNREYYCIFNDKGFQRRSFLSDKIRQIPMRKTPETYCMNATPYLTISSEKADFFNRCVDGSAHRFVMEYAAIFCEELLPIYQTEPTEEYFAYMHRRCRRLDAQAKRYGLLSMADRLNWTLCALFYGDDFVAEDSVLHRLMAAPQKNLALIGSRLAELKQARHDIDGKGR